ncbi:MAG: MFS transporter, partial [Mycobacteriales bacterium]
MTVSASAERRALLLVFAGFGAFWGAWAALVPAIQQQTGLNDGQLGLCFAAIAGAALPAMRLSGRLVDRYGAARLMPAALLLFALAVPLPALAHGAVALSLGCVLLGLATGVLDVVANVATAAWERLEDERLMALCHAAFSAGLLVGSVATGLSRDSGAGPGLVLPVVAGLLLVLSLRQPRYRLARIDGTPADGHGLPRALLMIGLLVAAAFLVEDAVQSWSALRLERGLGAAPWLSGLGPGL